MTNFAPYETVYIRKVYETANYQVLMDNGNIKIRHPISGKYVIYYKPDDYWLIGDTAVTTGSIYQSKTQALEKDDAIWEANNPFNPNKQPTVPIPGRDIKTECHLDLTKELQIMTNQLNRITEICKRLK